MRSRPTGLARCIRDVLIRITARPELATDPRLPAIEARAPDLIQDFIYLDRMTDLPKHDEQGTRDRPYDLIAHVDPAKLAPILDDLGLKPWLTRPRLLALVTITKGPEHYTLTAERDQGERLRQALTAAAETYGLRVALPTAPQIDSPLPNDSDRPTLNGALTWNEKEFGWHATWQLGPKTWDATGDSFDQAFRTGLAGAVRLLSAP